jgi:Xaa-Pro aminopeptidase
MIAYPNVKRALPMSRRISLALMTLLLVYPGIPLTAQRTGRSGAQEQRFFDWTTLPFASTEFRLRRQAMMAQLQQSGRGVFLSPSAEGFTSGETFRQEDDFFYFTGLELPRSMLVLDAEEALTILFVPRRDARFENPSRPNHFPGRPLADDPGLAARSEITQIRPIEDLDGYIAGLVADGRTIRINSNGTVVTTAASTAPIQPWSPETHLIHHLQTTYPSVEIQTAYLEIARLRMIKSDAEIVIMRRNAQLTAYAIMTAAGHIGDGVQERGLEAEFEAACKRGGSQRLAFSSIIKSGPNSLWPWRVLAAHYDRRNRAMHDGDLVIFDVGCELEHYSSDVGRTFPVSGRFTDDQRDILRMVTQVSDTIIAAVRPGITLRELQALAERTIPEDQRPYMQAGFFFGHHIGLSVGDPYLPDAMLEPGMVFTVEPWYYNHEAEIAVFVEDDVLVTATGAEVLTASLPRTPEDLERLVGVNR